MRQWRKSRDSGARDGDGNLKDEDCTRGAGIEVQGWEWQCRSGDCSAMGNGGALRRESGARDVDGTRKRMAQKMGYYDEWRRHEGYGWHEG